MKVNKEVLRRLEVAEKKLKSTAQTKFVVLDFDGCFFGECGFGLSPEQFDAWVKQRAMDVDVTVIKYVIDAEGNQLNKAVLNPIDAKKESSHEIEEKSN